MAATEQTMNFGLPPHALTGLQGVFRNHPSIQSVTLYGSRAKGNYRHNSDIDLMLTAPDMTWSQFNRVEQEIDDLLLPWKVDLALLHHIENQDLLDHIQRVGVVLFLRGQTPVHFAG
jgi:predicted nucleotidyltransferase